MTDENRISIWFFIGSILTIYGIIILIASLPGVGAPAEEMHVEMSTLHAGIWWGILLVILGVVYVFIFWPGRRKGDV